MRLSRLPFWSLAMILLVLSSISPLAAEAKAKLHKVKGTVVSVVESTLTIDAKANKKKGIEAGEQSFTVAADAKVTLNKEEVPLADLPAGANVEVHHRDGEAKKVIAKVPKAKKAKPEKPVKKDKKPKKDKQPNEVPAE